MRNQALVLFLSFVGPGLAAAQQNPTPCAYKLRSGDNDNGVFGSAVDYRGDRILVGEPQRFDFDAGPGSANVFVESSRGWIEEARLEPLDSSVGDRFGESVSIDGDLAVIGAPYRDHEVLGSETGAVYVFERTGTNWTQAARLIPTSLTGGDRFGWRVELEAGRIVATAPEQAPGGAAYVFEFFGGQWVVQQRLIGQGGLLWEQFGTGLAASGDRIVVGASNAHGKLLDERAGAGYVFEWDGQIWNRSHKLYSEDGRHGDDLGRSVALDGDNVILGGAYYSACGIFIGHAFAFRLAGASWVEEAAWDLSPADDFTWFGWAVELQGDRAFVSALQYGMGPGEIRVYERTASSTPSWQETNAFSGSPPMDYSVRQFGYDLAVHGDRLVVGAPDSEFSNGRVLVVDMPVEQETYCSGKINSLGCVPFLTTCGNPRMTGYPPFHIGAEDLLEDQPCLLVYGFEASQVPFHGGSLCVRPPLNRWLPAQPAGSDGANPACPGRFERDFSKHLRGGSDPLLSVGQTVHAQAWQRDPADPAGFGDSLTNAVRFVIQP